MLGVHGALSFWRGRTCGLQATNCPSCVMSWPCWCHAHADSGPSEASVTGAALECRVRPVNDGLQSVLALWCGFAPLSPADAEPGARERNAKFGIAFWSSLPVEVPAAGIEVG